MAQHKKRNGKVENESKSTKKMKNDHIAHQVLDKWDGPELHVTTSFATLPTEMESQTSLHDRLYCREENDMGLQLKLLSANPRGYPQPHHHGVVIHTSRLFLNLTAFSLHELDLSTVTKKTVFCNFCHRSLHSGIKSRSLENNIKLPDPTQYVFEHTAATLLATDELFKAGDGCMPELQGTWGDVILCFTFELWLDHQKLPSTRLSEFFGQTFPNLVRDVFTDPGIKPSIQRHTACVEDQIHLRRMLEKDELGGIAFVANGSILPRVSSLHDRPMQGEMVVPFQSPPRFEQEITLPHAGVVKGMLVPPGVTIIIGGGFHGKSTLLRALAVGVFNKIPEDGRELVVTTGSAVTIRSEDGRPVSNVDVSPFIGDLPRNTKIDTSDFSTSMASGSTSQAANVMEALEVGATTLLLDEDMCAANFMVRDSRMRAIVSHEPIVPYIYRVNSLWLQLGVSSIVVIGGCGDWFDVHNQVILMDNYSCEDKTKRATSISHTFCSGRVQFKGRGLVHRLDWPKDIDHRIPVPDSIYFEGQMGIHSIGKHLRYGEHEIDLSRVEQIVGGKGHVEGCGRALRWLAHKANAEPTRTLPQLLDCLEEEFEEHGVRLVLGGPDTIRPRRFEVAACLNRLICVSFSNQT